MKHLKKGAAVLLAVACQAPAWAVVTQEVLANAGFESDPAGQTIVDCTTYKKADGVTLEFPNHPQVTGKVGTGWDSNNCWMNKPSSVVKLSVEAGGHTGGYSQLIDTNGATGDAMLNSSWFNLSPNRRYTTRVWIKADAAAEVVVMLRENNGSYTPYGVKAQKLVANTWTEVVFQAIGPQVATSSAIYILPQGPAKFWIDDASVSSDDDTATTAVVNRSTTAIASNYFGVHVHADPLWPSVGSAIGSLRLWDAGGIPKLVGNTYQLDPSQGVNWISVFTADPATGGTPMWTAFDERLLQAKQNSAEVVMVLGGAIPAWASSHPNGTPDSFCDGYYAGNVPTGGSGAPPKDDNNDKIWKDWVTALATHAKSQKDQGKGGIRYWEVWNEPYQCKYFTQNPGRLATLVAEARAILKSVDATNVVLSPSFDLGDNVFLDRYLQAAQAAYPNGEAYGDILSVHFYDFGLGKYLDHRLNGDGVDPGDKDAAHRKSVETALYQNHLVLNTKMVLERFGLQNRPIWNTEGGYMGNGAATINGQPNEVEGAPFLARNYLMSWATGLDRNFYYAWDQRQGKGDVPPQVAVQSWPVVGAREVPLNSYQFVTTVAGVAYGQVSKWLSGATLESSLQDPWGNWVFKLRRGPALSTVVWNSNGPTAYPRPPGLTNMTNLAGVVSNAPASVTVTDSPVLFAAPATSVSMISSNQSVWQGWNANVKLTATVSGGSSPTGSVQFQLDGVNLGSPVALSGGQAILQTTDIDNAAVAIHALKAVYLGDSVNPSSGSPAGLTIKVCTFGGSCP